MKSAESLEASFMFLGSCILSRFSHSVSCWASTCIDVSPNCGYIIVLYAVYDEIPACLLTPIIPLLFLCYSVVKILNIFLQDVKIIYKTSSLLAD